MAKIIVIDDSESYLENVKDILELENEYEVLTASSARAGLEIIRKEKPDLIISDIDMPEMDGFELFNELKLDLETELCPVIFLTAKNSMDDLRYGMSLGVDDYIVKPFKAEDFLASVKIRLSRSRRLKSRLNRSDAESREYQDLKNDLMIAKQTQEGFLPSRKKKYPGIDFEYSYHPVIDVGGDFFSITELDDGRIRIFLSDALGHGISASIFNMAIKVEYDSLKNSPDSPSVILSELNKRFCDKNSDLNTLFPGFIFDLHIKGNFLVYASGGFVPPVLIQDFSMQQLERTGTVLGYSEKAKYKDRKIRFERGDRIIFYTDGILENLNRRNEIFGLSGLLNSIQMTLFESEKRKVIEKIISDVKLFIGGGDFSDDATVLAVEHTGSPRHKLAEITKNKYR